MELEFKLDKNLMILQISISTKIGREYQYCPPWVDTGLGVPGNISLGKEVEETHGTYKGLGETRYIHHNHHRKQRVVSAKIEIWIKS